MQSFLDRSVSSSSVISLLNLSSSPTTRNSTISIDSEPSLTRAQSVSAEPDSAATPKPFSQKFVLEGNSFISPDMYAAATNREQMTRDWIRHQDHIFLNGYPLRDITTNLKKEYFKSLLNTYLYHHTTCTEFSNRLQTLKEFSLLLIGDATGSEFIDYRLQTPVGDELAYRLVLRLRAIGYDLKKTIKSDSKNSQSTPAAATRELQLLHLIVEKLRQYFSIERIDASAELLEKILKQYLFYDITPVSALQNYLHFFQQYAHQGGFLYALFTAHLQHLDKMKYVVFSDASIQQTRIDIKTHENTILIEEVTPIASIHCLDESRALQCAEQSNIAETQLIQRLSLDAAGKPVLKILTAATTIFYLEAIDILLGKWLQLKANLSNFANSYIQLGHHATLTQTVLPLYPWIKERYRGNKENRFSQLFKSAKQHDSDKILMSLGDCLPSYAESLYIHVGHYAELGYEPFRRVMKLLQLMGRQDIATKILLPYFFAHDKVLKIQHHLTERVIRAGYDYLLTQNLFPHSEIAIDRRSPSF